MIAFRPSGEFDARAFDLNDICVRADRKEQVNESRNDRDIAPSFRVSRESVAVACCLFYVITRLDVEVDLSAGSIVASSQICKVTRSAIIGIFVHLLLRLSCT